MHETNSTDRRIPPAYSRHRDSYNRHIAGDIEDVKLTSAENKAIRPDSMVTVAKRSKQQGNRS
jgi:hypothetical protein